jgi:hypothetical protein
MAYNGLINQPPDQLKIFYSFLRGILTNRKSPCRLEEERGKSEISAGA